MAKSWTQFVKNLETRAKVAGPTHVQTLRALQQHYRKMGAELAQERKELGLSQESLAKATGIDQAEISRIERDQVDPRLGTYVRLLEGMGLGLRVVPLPRARGKLVEKPRHLSARSSRG